MTINPFFAVSDIASLTPDLKVWTMRLTDTRFNLDKVLCEVAYTDRQGVTSHPWLDPWLMAEERTVDVIPMPLRDYLRLHLKEHQPSNQAHEHRRREFLDAWRALHEPNTEEPKS